jgi:hypothetical protein
VIEIKPIKEFATFIGATHGVISTCENFHSCCDPLYIGKCREDCFKIHRRMMGEQEKEMGVEL